MIADLPALVVAWLSISAILFLMGWLASGVVEFLTSVFADFLASVYERDDDDTQ